MKKLIAIAPLALIAACAQPVEICNDDLFFDDKIGGPTSTCEREPRATLFGPFQGIAKDRSDRRDAFFGRDKPVERVSENPPYEESETPKSSGGSGTPKSSGGSSTPPSTGGSGTPRPEPIPYDETPIVPEVPEGPETPEQPEEPETPEQPQEPEQPEAPEEEPELIPGVDFSDGYTNGWTPERKAADIARREAAGLPTRRESICRSQRVQDNPERGEAFRCDLLD